jgi:hypothetical protein
MNMRAKRSELKVTEQMTEEVGDVPLVHRTLDAPFRIPGRGVAPWRTLLAISDMLLDVCRSRGLYKRLDDAICNLHAPSIGEVLELVRELKKK